MNTNEFAELSLDEYLQTILNRQNTHRTKMSLNIDPSKLRQMTDQAIADAEQRRKEKLAEIKAKQERQHLADLLQAESIISQIPDRCAKEAEAGRSHAIVMGLKHRKDYSYDSKNWNNLDPSRLQGVGALVWNACQKLNPTLEYWYSGDGMESGFNIVVHW